LEDFSNKNNFSRIDTRKIMKKKINFMDILNYKNNHVLLISKSFKNDKLKKNVIKANIINCKDSKNIINIDKLKNYHKITNNRIEKEKKENKLYLNDKDIYKSFKLDKQVNNNNDANHKITGLDSYNKKTFRKTNLLLMNNINKKNDIVINKILGKAKTPKISDINKIKSHFILYNKKNKIIEKKTEKNTDDNLKKDDINKNTKGKNLNNNIKDKKKNDTKEKEKKLDKSINFQICKTNELSFNDNKQKVNNKISQNNTTNSNIIIIINNPDKKLRKNIIIPGIKKNTINMDIKKLISDKDKNNDNIENLIIKKNIDNNKAKENLDNNKSKDNFDNGKNT